MRSADGFRRLADARFLRFCLVGGTATLIHAGVFLAACAVPVSTFTANLLGYVVSLSFNIAANFAWTFAQDLRAPGAAGRIGRFALVTLGGFVLNTGISAGMIDGLDARPVWAALLMVTVTPVAVYLLGVRLVVDRPTALSNRGAGAQPASGRITPT